MRESFVFKYERFTDTDLYQHLMILLSQDSDEATAPVNVLNLQSTWNRRNEPWQVTVGVRNALNASYSGWVQANAPRDKFYNPAPPRTAFLSVRLTFNE